MELAAAASMYAAAPDHLPAAHTWVGDALCLRYPGVPARELNRVIGPATDLDAIDAFFEGGQYIVCGGECPPGFSPGYAWMIFERPADAGAAAPTDLRLEVVGPDRGVDFAAPIQVAFGMPEAFVPWLAALTGAPGWTCLVAYAGDAAVASGGLFVAGTEGWLGFGATLPEARGQGAQSAILARRIALAAEQGATLVTTETGVREPGKADRSYRNILRAGFSEAGARHNWNSPGSTW